ncbi:TetR/AcrR family transcriptional regulator [Aureimonas flava]|uniref:TetR/AcrR family transcriptional regulator n=1 Tax=Aureimonas flava TaxID=2320271 RepID=A0A3A1WH59_9HYPH|nr:TetR/AcrR family transcriptional regulator [Aureimonas flava]
MPTWRGPGGAAVRRSSVTDALRRTFGEWARVGYAALRLERVAKRAGVGKAVLHRRWSSKSATAKRPPGPSRPVHHASGRHGIARGRPRGAPYRGLPRSVPPDDPAHPHGPSCRDRSRARSGAGHPSVPVGTHAHALAISRTAQTRGESRMRLSTSGRSPTVWRPRSTGASL